MELQDESILEEFECLVCREYLCPPINLCPTGHSMCEKCRRRLAVCPICDVTIGNGRNFQLENIIVKFKLPCKNREAGCMILETSDQRKIHEEFCEFGDISCPLRDSFACPWTGRLKDLLIHARHNDSHLSLFLNNREHCLKGIFRFVGEKKWFSLVNAYGKTFKYCFNIDYINTMLIKWNVQFVGPRKEASDYSYVITFIDKSKTQKKLTIISTCEPLAYDKHAFVSATCVNHNQLIQFHSSNESLYFHFKIVLTKDLDALLPTLVDNAEEDTPSSSEPKRLKMSDYACGEPSENLQQCVNIALLIPVNDISSEADSD